MREKLKCLKLSITILLILEILTGVLLICITARYQRVLVMYLTKTERKALIGQLSGIYLLGFEFIVSYSVGLIFWRFIWWKKSEKLVEHSKLLAAWNGFCMLIDICGSVTVWFLYSNAESLQNVASTSLFQGIDLYFSDPEWKLLWDGIQYHNECCGVNGYEDWKEAVWMPEEQSKCQPMPESRILMLIPYACCKRSVTSCFQNYAPHLSAASVPSLNSTDININGCLPKFKYIICQLFYNLAYIMTIGFITQILLLIFGLITISKMKRLPFDLSDCSGDNDDRPLVVVKYPRNVRCITLPDEENFNDVDEDEEEDNFDRGHKCRSTATEGISMRQEITDDWNGEKHIFLH